MPELLLIYSRDVQDLDPMESWKERQRAWRRSRGCSLLENSDLIYEALKIQNPTTGCTFNGDFRRHGAIIQQARLCISRGEQNEIGVFQNLLVL